MVIIIYAILKVNIKDMMIKQSGSIYTIDVSAI